MANFDQTPSGQANVDLVLPSLAFGVGGAGTWNQPNYAFSGGSTINLTLGGGTTTAPSSAAPFSINPPYRRPLRVIE